LIRPLAISTDPALTSRKQTLRAPSCRAGELLVALHRTGHDGRPEDAEQGKIERVADRLVALVDVIEVVDELEDEEADGQGGAWGNHAEVTPWLALPDRGGSAGATPEEEAGVLVGDQRHHR